MRRIKRQITKALSVYGGQITRFWININLFEPIAPEGTVMACAHFGGGRRLAVTYRMREDS